MNSFTHEEIALMSHYDNSSLSSLLAALELMLPHVEDEPAAETTTECIRKLRLMTDAEFPALMKLLATPEMF